MREEHHVFFLQSYRNRKGGPLSNRRQVLKLIIIRKFLSFLVRQDVLLKNPASPLTLPKEEKRLTRNILTEREVMELLVNMKLTDPVSIRNRAIDAQSVSSERAKSVRRIAVARATKGIDLCLGVYLNLNSDSHLPLPA